MKKNNNTWNSVYGNGMLWSNMSSKPTGFSYVKGQPMTYKYYIKVFCFKEKEAIDNILINMKLYVKDDIREIDLGFFYNYIREHYNINDVYSYNDSLFIRDGSAFPFISYITINNKEEYFINKNKKIRLDKLNKLFNDENKNL